MIIFSRKVGDSIVISDDIIVTIVQIRDDKVRIGVEAPKEVPIHRKEVFEAIQQACGSHQEDSPQGRWRLLRRFFGG
ncbi:carbon storage regulator CsrA [Planctomycetota bacterium]